MNQAPETNKIVIWCDRIMAFGFYVFIFYVPISIVMVEYAFGFVFLPFVVKRLVLYRIGLREKTGEKGTSVFKKIGGFFKAFKPIDSYLTVPVTIFVLINFLSVLASQYPVMSMKGFVFKLLQSVYFYFLLPECINTKKRLKIFMAVFLVSAVLVMTSGMVQFFAGKDFIFGHILQGGRVTSAFRHANDFGSYLIFVCLLSLSFILFRGCSQPKTLSGVKENSRCLPGVFCNILAVAVFGLSVTSLGLTYSRGAWIGFFAALLFLGIKDIRTLVVSFLIIFVFYAVFTPKMGVYRKTSLIHDDIHLKKTEEQQRPSVRQQSGLGVSGSGRTVYWQEALDIIRDFPVLGTGLNTYSQVGKKYKISWGGYPHNSYLHMAAETGILGLLSFIWVIVVLLKNSIIRIRRNLEDKFLLSVLCGAAAGIIGFLLHSGVDTNFYSVQLGNYMWVIFGLMVAVQQLDLKTSHDIPA